MSNRTYSQDELTAVLKGFGIADPTDVSRYGSGHINDTFKVETKRGVRYILQRVTDAFDKDILRNNIIRVTDHLKAKGVKTLEVLGYENPWRLYAFLEGYTSVDVITDPAQAELAAGAFAAFQNGQPQEKTSNPSAYRGMCIIRTIGSPLAASVSQNFS